METETPQPLNHNGKQLNILDLKKERKLTVLILSPTGHMIYLLYNLGILLLNSKEKDT